MCVGELLGCGNQIHRSQIMFLALRLSVHDTRLACFLALVLRGFFVWRPLERLNTPSWRILNGSFSSFNRRWMLLFFLKCVRLVLFAILFSDVFEKFCKQLVETISRYVLHIKCCTGFFTKILKLFPLAVCLPYGVCRLLGRDEIVELLTWVGFILFTFFSLPSF